MKITEIIVESQLDEYGNNPNDSSDPRIAGNLKARRLARSQKPQQSSQPAPVAQQPAPVAAQAPEQPAEPSTAPAPKATTKPGRSPIDDLLDAPDEPPMPKDEKEDTDSYIQKLTNIVNHAGLKSNYAVGQYSLDKKDHTTGYELNQQIWKSAKVSPNKDQISLPAYGDAPATSYNRKGRDWYDASGALVQDKNLLQALNSKAI
jgi:hypothetical protein